MIKTKRRRIYRTKNGLRWIVAGGRKHYLEEPDFYKWVGIDQAAIEELGRAFDLVQRDDNDFGGLTTEALEAIAAARTTLCHLKDKLIRKRFGLHPGGNGGLREYLEILELSKPNGE